MLSAGQQNNLHLDLSVTKSDFGHTNDKDHPRKRSARPTSNTRHNNPHSEAFRTQLLPNGQIINVSSRLEGAPRPLVSRNPADPLPPSESQSSYVTINQKGWQKNNTKRYGCNSQPWANSSDPAHGITPVVTSNNYQRSDFSTTTHDSYVMKGFQQTSPFPSSRRNPMKFDETVNDTLSTVVRDMEAKGAIEEWLKNAPGFEGEIVARMLKDVHARMSRPNTPNQQDGNVSPKARYVSKWPGPI